MYIYIWIINPYQSTIRKPVSSIEKPPSVRPSSWWKHSPYSAPFVKWSTGRTRMRRSSPSPLWPNLASTCAKISRTFPRHSTWGVNGGPGVEIWVAKMLGNPPNSNEFWPFGSNGWNLEHLGNACYWCSFFCTFLLRYTHAYMIIVWAQWAAAWPNLALGTDNAHGSKLFKQIQAPFDGLIFQNVSTRVSNLTTTWSVKVLKQKKAKQRAPAPPLARCLSCGTVTMQLVQGKHPRSTCCIFRRARRDFRSEGKNGCGSLRMWNLFSLSACCSTIQIAISGWTNTTQSSHRYWSTQNFAGRPPRVSGNCELTLLATWPKRLWFSMEVWDSIACASNPRAGAVIADRV